MGQTMSLIGETSQVSPASSMSSISSKNGTEEWEIHNRVCPSASMKSISSKNGTKEWKILKNVS